MTTFTRRELATLAGIVAFYLVAAKFTAIFFARDNTITFVWLAFGPSTVAVYVVGNRMTAAVFVGALLGFLLGGQDLEASLMGSLRHTLVVFIGTWMLRRKGSFDPALGTLGDYQRIFAVACVLGLIAAALAESQKWMGAIPSTFTFTQFFAGAMLSNLIGVPFFLVWRKPPVHWANARTSLAALLILGLSWLVGQVVFLDWLKDTLGQIARGYWMYLLITWAAVRLGPHGAVLVVAMTAIQALIGAEYGVGFFSNDIARTHLANYYFYMLCLSAVGMALATYFAQQQKATRELRGYQHHLEELVGERTARVETLNEELRHLNNGLESTVAERTRELDAKVAELDRLNAELARKNEEMESMIYTASHDLRSPLVNIQGFGQRLEKALGEIRARLAEPDVPEAVRESLARPLTDRMPKALGFINTSSLKMDSLINGLLRLSRAGRVNLAIQPLDMNAMLRDIVGNLTIQTQKAEARVSVDALPACLGDPTQVNQVFTNLIDNAIKYRDLRRPLAIVVSGIRDGQRVRYEVADTGIGIAEEFQPKVWQLFHRLDPNGPVAGEGIGLTLVRRIVERMHGHISLASAPGQGSRFTVELPAVPAEGAHAS